MLIYDKTALQNLTIRHEATRWRESGIISPEELTRIEEAHACDFYTPGFFIRLTLFLATTVAVSAGLGLMAMFVLGLQELGLALLLLIYGVATYKFLEEIIIKQKKFFHAGVDDALIFLACGFVIIGLLILLHNTFGALSPPFRYLVALPFLAWFAVRFVNPVMTVLAFSCCFGFLFLQTLELGGWAKAILPFVVMLASVPFSVYSNRKLDLAEFAPWRACLQILKTLSLMTFYAGGNYFVVRELSESLLNMQVAPGEDIPLAFVFYALTAIVPLAYIGWGLKARDMIFIRTGMLVLALSILTLKYYFSIAPPEITLTVAGAALIALAVAIIKYLKHPVNGYTHKNLLKRSADSLDAEALLVAETMASTPQQQAPDSSFKPGGGESGGAGAEGSY